jgi:hypothetical protein
MQREDEWIKPGALNLLKKGKEKIDPVNWSLRRFAPFTGKPKH